MDVITHPCHNFIDGLVKLPSFGVRHGWVIVPHPTGNNKLHYISMPKLEFINEHPTYDYLWPYWTGTREIYAEVMIPRHMIQLYLLILWNCLLHDCFFSARKVPYVGAKWWSRNICATGLLLVWHLNEWRIDGFIIMVFMISFIIKEKMFVKFCEIKLVLLVLKLCAVHFIAIFDGRWNNIH